MTGPWNTTSRRSLSPNGTSGNGAAKSAGTPSAASISSWAIFRRALEIFPGSVRLYPADRPSAGRGAVSLQYRARAPQARRRPPRPSTTFPGAWGAASLSGKGSSRRTFLTGLGTSIVSGDRGRNPQDCYIQAQRVGGEVGQPHAIWEAEVGLAALSEARGYFPSAVDHYLKAIGVIEDLRVQLLLREYSSGFFKNKVVIYEALVDLLFGDCERGPSPAVIEECLYYAEKAKARSFLDDLQKARIDSALPVPGEGGRAGADLAEDLASLGGTELRGPESGGPDCASGEAREDGGRLSALYREGAGRKSRIFPGGFE